MVPRQSIGVSCAKSFERKSAQPASDSESDSESNCDSNRGAIRCSLVPENLSLCSALKCRYTPHSLDTYIYYLVCIYFHIYIYVYSIGDRQCTFFFLPHFSTVSALAAAFVVFSCLSLFPSLFLYLVVAF